jgi:vitamin B12/bleomycin/antimicrobial peptide transport system ATP-binding/permease protein
MSLIRALSERHTFRKTSDTDEENREDISEHWDDTNDGTEDEEDGIFSTNKKPPSILGRLRQRLSRTHSNLVKIPDKGNKKQTPAFNWRQIRRQLWMLRRLVGPYFVESSKARCMLLSILGLTVVNSGMSITLSYAARYFWNALAARDIESFTSVFALYVFLMVIISPIDGYFQFVIDQLKIHWREWMSKRTLGLYLSDRVYFKLSDEIDNPDQRISEDIATFTDSSLHFAILLISNAMGSCSFSVVLWSIYPPLFFAVLVYAASGTVITTLLGRVLIPLNYAKLRSEADLRYSMVRLRDNAESVAFYQGEALEGAHVTSRLDDVVENQQNLNVASRNLGFFTIFFHHLSSVLPILVIANKYFAGEVKIGVITQSVGAFSAILGNLSIIINNFKLLSHFSAGVERLICFYEAMKDADSNHDENSSILSFGESTESEQRPREALVASNDPLETPNSLQTSRRSRGDMTSIRMKDTICLRMWRYDPTDTVLMNIDDLRLCTPDYRRTLISDLSFTLNSKDRLLITGGSGCGKSGLLRAVAGLWTAGKGTIGRTNNAFFLPQRPYCVTGTLRDQILYPKPDKKYHDHELLHILAQVDLSDLAERCGDGDMYAGLSVVLDWSNVLSLGEQQRLSFSRLLVHRPQLAILDESTSALDVDSEARMYELLRSVPGYVSVGHRPTLNRFHTKKLNLSGDNVKHSIISLRSGEKGVGGGRNAVRSKSFVTVTKLNGFQQFPQTSNK